MSKNERSSNSRPALPPWVERNGETDTTYSYVQYDALTSEPFQRTVGSFTAGTFSYRPSVAQEKVIRGQSITFGRPLSLESVERVDRVLSRRSFSLSSDRPTFRFHPRHVRLLASPRQKVREKSIIGGPTRRRLQYKLRLLCSSRTRTICPMVGLSGTPTYMHECTRTLACCHSCLSVFLYYSGRSRYGRALA